MSWVQSMNKLTGPRNAAEAHGVRVGPWHPCAHACMVQPSGVVGYHPLCREKADCVLTPMVERQRCPWDDWKPERGFT